MGGTSVYENKHSVRTAGMHAPVDADTNLQLHTQTQTKFCWLQVGIQCFARRLRTDLVLTLASLRRSKLASAFAATSAACASVANCRNEITLRGRRRQRTTYTELRHSPCQLRRPTNQPTNQPHALDLLERQSTRQTRKQ